MRSEGRLEWRDFGRGERPVRVIFCFGGAGIFLEDDEEEADESDSSPISFERFRFGKDADGLDRPPLI